MKIVIAEKMSSSAVNLLREPDWTVITPDQLNGSLATELERQTPCWCGRPSK